MVDNFIFWHKNRKAWIRIIEAFFAILLVAAVLFIVLEQQAPQQTSSSAVYNYEAYMLRSVELNDTLRGEIISISDSSLPVNSTYSAFPLYTNKTLSALTPGTMTCISQICKYNSNCNLNLNDKKDIYSQGILITATIQQYNPRQLKIFCWMK
ncbi:MAG: hypothetical protein KGH55_01295 [Nanoarchaeota archaeon]|nr:hypothetical protein [Nanoarchaeota archaeon]